MMVLTSYATFMKQLIFRLFVFISFSLSAQNVDKKLNLNDDKTTIRSFENLPKIEYLDSIAISVKKIKRFNSIDGCLMQLARIDSRDSKLAKFIFQRLRDISEKLYAENNPIILEFTRECNNRIEEYQVDGKMKEVKFLCEFSDGCIIPKFVTEGIEEFNKKTKAQLGWNDTQ